jgi:hypothetical protein
MIIIVNNIIEVATILIVFMNASSVGVTARKMSKKSANENITILDICTFESVEFVMSYKNLELFVVEDVMLFLSSMMVDCFVMGVSLTVIVAPVAPVIRSTL